jgi:hypothetical protein
MPKPTWGDKIKIDLTINRFRGLDWIDLGKNRDR